MKNSGCVCVFICFHLFIVNFFLFKKKTNLCAHHNRQQEAQNDGATIEELASNLKIAREREQTTHLQLKASGWLFIWNEHTYTHKKKTHTIFFKKT